MCIVLLISTAGQIDLPHVCTLQTSCEASSYIQTILAKLHIDHLISTKKNTTVTVEAACESSMKDKICHYKYNSTKTEQIELHLVWTHISLVV